MSKRAVLSVILITWTTACSVWGREMRPTPTLVAPLLGMVTGTLSYPSEGVPAMNLYFENIATGHVTDMPIASGQLTYTTSLPIGDYFVYAWTIPSLENGIPKLAGGFTRLEHEYLVCDYFELQVITVKPAKVTEGIDVFNWYAPAGAFPAPPTEIAGQGALAGTIILPEAATTLTTVFAQQAASGKVFTTTTDSSDFEFKALPEGWYYIYARTPAGNAELVTSYSLEGVCGGLPTCERRCMTPAEVRANELRSNIVLVNWYDELVVPQSTR